MLTEYETTLVLRPNIGGDTVETTLDKIRNVVDGGGKLIAINHWGKKRLAYEIKKHNRGVYVHAHYLGVGPMVAEIERTLRLSEDVLRYLTVKLADAVDPASRDVIEYERPAYEAADEIAEEAADEPVGYGLRGPHGDSDLDDNDRRVGDDDDDSDLEEKV